MNFLSPETILMLLLAGNLIVLCGTLFFSKEMNLEIPLSQRDRLLWRCDICLHTYLGQASSEHSRCPQCGCMVSKRKNS